MASECLVRVQSWFNVRHTRQKGWKGDLGHVGKKVKSQANGRGAEVVSQSIGRTECERTRGG